MSEKKTPKKEYFAQIVEALREANHDELANVMVHEIELLDKKAATAKASAAKRKKANDELTSAVKAVLTDELATIPDITALVEGDEVTVARVQYRLNALVKAHEARKEQITISEGEGKSRKVMAYALADAE